MDPSSSRRRVSLCAALGLFLFAALLLEPVVGIGARADAATASTITRLGGGDRYATAAAISRASFPPGVPLAFVSTGRTFPDALTAAPAAATRGGPMLLVDRGSVPAVTLTELDRLNPGRIVIIGGTSVVSQAVASQLDAYDTGGGVVRIGGATRYDTAVEISKAFFSASVETAYVATGHNFPDALAAAPVAGRDGVPILLTDPDEVPSTVLTELARLAPARIVIVGGTAAIHERVAEQLRRITSNVTRLAGEDRYATAAMIVRDSFGNNVPAYIATGTTFPDALAGAVVAGRTAGPVLLVTRDSVPAPTVAELKRILPPKVVLLGQSAVVGDGALTGIRNALGQGGPFVFKPWNGTTAFQQENNIYCVPASIKTMLVVSMGGTDASQTTIYEYGRAHMGYPISGPGHDPQAWALSLNHFGGAEAGTYVDSSYGSYAAALRAAVEAIRATGKTAGIPINAGTHAWVIAGFQTSNDPALTTDYSIVGVYVVGPYTAWTDPPPGTFLSRSQLQAKLTPYYEPERWTRWNGTYVVIRPTK